MFNNSFIPKFFFNWKEIKSLFFENRKCTNKILIRKKENQLNFGFYVAKYVFKKMIQLIKAPFILVCKQTKKRNKPTQKEQIKTAIAISK
jgi:hypothetical protein